MTLVSGASTRPAPAPATDAGPHPNPAKAADGKRLHKLDIDPEAMSVVRRIFAEFSAGSGFYAIAEGLTRDGIPSPSAHDPGRNSHRSGIAWSKFAVRAILANPRYTGYQVWNKQRKDEVFIDVEDLALGHTTKLRWNDKGEWVWSDKIVQPPIIARRHFEQVQALLNGRASDPAKHKPHRSQHPYALRGCVWCGLCDRRMQGHWVHQAPYYRCRFPADYALANRVEHPLSVNLREDAIIGHVDHWLAKELAPHRIGQTIRDLVDAQETTKAPVTDIEEAKRQIAECNRKLGQYRAALNEGGNATTIGKWIAETEAERARHELSMRKVTGNGRMTEAEIRSIVDKLGNIAEVLGNADPLDKAEVFRQLGLKLTYHPGRQLVTATVEPAGCGFFESVRGGT
jgi:site-specific DNA recombinase